jgi:DNA-binding winged helix-turn-helix (wHTH) protein
MRFGGRALDVLIALIEPSRALVSKDELLSRAWRTRSRAQDYRAAQRL